MIDSLLKIDTDILLWSHALVGEEYSLILQILGEIGVIWTLGFLLFLWFRGKIKDDNGIKIIVLQIGITITLTYIFYTVIHLFFPPWRPNPQEVVQAIGALIPRPFDNSFPSGHGLFTGALLVSLLRFYPNTFYISLSFIFCILMVTSRVLVGVHYPGDIIGGIILGGFGAYIVSLFTAHQIARQYIYAPIIRLLSYIKL